jgi:hypothetical protein
MFVGPWTMNHAWYSLKAYHDLFMLVMVMDIAESIARLARSPNSIVSISN